MCKMGPVFSSVNVGQNNPRQYLPPASEGGGTLENLPDTDTGDDVLFLNLVSDFKSNNRIELQREDLMLLSCLDPAS